MREKPQFIQTQYCRHLDEFRSDRRVCSCQISSVLLRPVLTTCSFKKWQISAQCLLRIPGREIVIISCYCCRQAQQPVLFCKHSSDPEKSVQHLCNIIVITQIVCTFLLNGGMTKTDQPVPRLCYCFLYTHLSPLCPLSRCQDFFCILQGTCIFNLSIKVFSSYLKEGVVCLEVFV